MIPDSQAIITMKDITTRRKKAKRKRSLSSVKGYGKALERKVLGLRPLRYNVDSVKEMKVKRLPVMK